MQFVLEIDPDSRETLSRILQAKANPRAPAAASSGAPHHRRAVRRCSAPPRRRRATNGRSRVDTERRPRVPSTASTRSPCAGSSTATGPWGRAPRLTRTLEALLKPEPAEPATLAQALAEMPRLLAPAPRHRSGATRTLESTPVANKRGRERLVSAGRERVGAEAVVNGESHESPPSDADRKVFD